MPIEVIQLAEEIRNHLVPILKNKVQNDRKGQSITHTGDQISYGWNQENKHIGCE